MIDDYESQDTSRTRALLERMKERGRRPSFDATGSIRGFRSRPGATPSPMDTTSAASALGASRDPQTGLTSQSKWDQFFAGANANTQARNDRFMEAKGMTFPGARTPVTLQAGVTNPAVQNGVQLSTPGFKLGLPEAPSGFDLPASTMALKSFTDPKGKLRPRWLTMNRNESPYI